MGKIVDCFNSYAHRHTHKQKYTAELSVASKTLQNTFDIKHSTDDDQRPETVYIDFKCSTIIYRDQ